MNCPKCHANLDRVQVFNVHFHRCSGCKGIWCGDNELHLLENLKDAEMFDIGEPLVGKAFDLAIVGHCPQCEQISLVTKAVLGHEYLRAEHCPECASWFLDAGELSECRNRSFLAQTKAVMSRWLAA